ncbi:hypothetical protein Anas_08819, partial [Armadillidium nasatum]
GTSRFGSVSNIPFETPPSSQNSQEILKTPEFKVSNRIFGCSTPEENVREDHIVGRIETPKRTPSEKRYPSKKCRVSGLKKLQGSVGKEKQLNLRDMFSFKKLDYFYLNKDLFFKRYLGKNQLINMKNVTLENK